MNRRTFVGTLTFGLLAAPLAAGAQQTGKVYRIGVLSTGSPEQESSIWTDLRGQLRERGWVEGKNLAIDWRYAEAKYERLPDLAVELVALKPDLVMARGGPGATAAKRATATIPIVMYNATDPVGIGLVESLARPGGNVTGLSDDQGAEIIGKRLQLLKEVAPTVSKLASLTRVPPSATVPRIAANENAFDAGIKALGMQAQTWRIRGPDDIDKAFAAILKEGIGALYVNHVSVIWINRRQILDLAARHRLPAIYYHRTYAVDGGLMAYAEDEREVPRRLAAYVDRILRGAKPRRPTGRATHEVRARHQPEDRHPRPDHPAIGAGAG
jgi:putative tryptophan/tyrosine transport system substrate-binding protein